MITLVSMIPHQHWPHTSFPWKTSSPKIHLVCQVLCNNYSISFISTAVSVFVSGRVRGCGNTHQWAGSQKFWPLNIIRNVAWRGWCHIAPRRPASLLVTPRLDKIVQKVSLIKNFTTHYTNTTKMPVRSDHFKNLNFAREKTIKIITVDVFQSWFVNVQRLFTSVTFSTFAEFFSIAFQNFQKIFPNHNFVFEVE